MAIRTMNCQQPRPSRRQRHQRSGLLAATCSAPRVANAADIVPVVTAEDDGGHVDADARFVGGARSQADVVQRLKRSRRPQQRPAPQKLAYGDEPDNSKSDNIDDTYEGPQSASDAPSQSAALNGTRRRRRRGLPASPATLRA